jgi:hypothetical protein
MQVVAVAGIAMLLMAVLAVEVMAQNGVAQQRHKMALIMAVVVAVHKVAVVVHLMQLLVIKVSA